MSQRQASNTVMIMAGGTGGHIFPGLAVAHALKARGIHVVWLGSEGGMETRLVAEQGFELVTVAIKGLRGKAIASLLKAPFSISQAIFNALALMRQVNPQVVISFGGYVAGPGGVTATLQRRALIVHEQNCAPGLTNRLLVRIAKKVLTGFPGSFKTRPHTVVGNPVRPQISAIAAPELRYRQHDGALRLLILGGSQGARAINAMLPGIFASIETQAVFDIRHQCGEKLLAETETTYRAVGINARIEPFINDMAAAYAWADLVIGRAGALTVAELCAAGVASILIPLPTAVDDHQAKNADYLQTCGGGVWFRQDQHLESNLQRCLTEFAAQPERLLAMAKAARAAAFPNAAEDVADIIVQEMAA